MADSKTLGQMLREAREAWELEYQSTGIYDPNWRELCDEFAATAVWNEAMEAFADCIETSPLIHSSAREPIAHSLRSLKRQIEEARSADDETATSTESA